MFAFGHGMAGAQGDATGIAANAYCWLRTISLCACCCTMSCCRPGFVVDSVATMREAFAQLDERTYHLVLTDDRLPDGRGVRIAEHAKALGVDAVVITGYMLQSAAADLDAHEHLMKPIRPDELIEVVDRHMAGGVSDRR